MWKVLLVDDESVIVGGLKKMIDWESLHTQVIGEARDGKMALEMIGKYHPDIVISDIKMPFMSGIDLIKEIQERKLSVKNFPIQKKRYPMGRLTIY